MENKHKNSLTERKVLIYVTSLAILALVSSTFFWSLSWFILTLFVIGLAALIYFSLRREKSLQKISLFLITIILGGFSLFCILLANSNM